MCQLEFKCKRHWLVGITSSQSYFMSMHCEMFCALKKYHGIIAKQKSVVFGRHGHVDHKCEQDMTKQNYF